MDGKLDFSKESTINISCKLPKGTICATQASYTSGNVNPPSSGSSNGSGTN